MSTRDAPYLVLCWDGDGLTDDPLHTARTLYVRHRLGECITKQMVLDQFQAEVGHYPPCRYRIYPGDTVLDVHVQAKVVEA